MRVYLAGDVYLREILASKTDKELSDLYFLRTFASKEPWFMPYYGKCKDIILDSGAFTFMAGKDASNVDWNDYIERYAGFINATGVEHFIELDIDVIVGYEKVKELRNKLIGLTGKQPIPVWHKTRGKDEFLRLCDEFDYVALGGFAIKNWTRKNFKYIPWFIDEAHKRGAKIHGLGFTCFNELPKLHFDSVDSSSWTIGSRFGSINRFDGQKVINIQRPPGSRVADQRKLAQHNFNEWEKFQKYAELAL